jgi:NitT/TauT family transport system substrate-binding protein
LIIRVCEETQSKMPLSRSRFITIAALAATVGARLPANAQTAPLRVGIVPADTYAEAYFANQAGIFQRNGLAVELTVLANGGAVGVAVASGALDIGMGSLGQIASARENGTPFYLIAPGSLFNSKEPPSELRVALTSTLRTARDLNGKTIAIDNLRGLPQISVDTWIEKNGGDHATIKYLELPFTAMAAALQAGRIDAALIAEPALTAARNMTRPIASTLASIGPSFYISVWYATKPWLAQNAAVAHRFAAAIDQAARWANTHHAESAPMLEALTKVPHDVSSTMNRAYFGTRLDAKFVDPVLVVSQRYGVTKTVVDGKSLIYDGF